MIKLQNITKRYGDVIPLNDVNVVIPDGQFVSIVGTSGSGKTTLMNILGTLDMPTVGDYFLDGIYINKASSRELSAIRNQKIGFIFQNFNLISKLSAFENVELPLIFAGIDKPKRRVICEVALEKVGLSHRINHKPTEMSGGQQQRVAIARAIAMSPPIILADEPTGNLDPNSSAEILEILKNLNLDGRLIVLITHDMEVANNAQRIISIEGGKIISDKMKSI
ncbi:MAG: ABC transporter ATP-binding protein [Clostridia bacterium]